MYRLRHTNVTGAIYPMSTRQKLNTKSSTESDLIGVDDVVLLVLWTRQFMEGQGYVINDNVVYQDNQSSILLENNRQQSSTKRTRQLDISKKRRKWCYFPAISPSL